MNDRIAELESENAALRQQLPITAEQMRLLRAISGCSQSEIAKMCGVTQQAVARWERAGAPAKWRIDAIFSLVIKEAELRGMTL